MSIVTKVRGDERVVTTGCVVGKRVHVQHGKGQEVSRVKSKVEAVRHTGNRNRERKGKKTQQKKTLRHWPKQFSDLLVLSENDVDALSPQFIEFFEGDASNACRDHPQIVLCDNYPIQPSADAGGTQTVGDVDP